MITKIKPKKDWHVRFMGVEVFIPNKIAKQLLKAKLVKEVKEGFLEINP